VNEPRVDVIIAAKDAAATIGRAVASALVEPETAKVIVIDDGSSDDTVDAARLADDGTGRLLVASLPQNQGPSAARNHALRISESAYIAILDADDFLVPGRFARLFAEPDWDIIADNILFVPEQKLSDPQAIIPPDLAPEPRLISFVDFVDGNVSRYSRKRSQLGFLKPVIRREMLDQFDLRYAPAVRLGEDFLLVVQLLAHGARFKVLRSCGYIAVERGASLSAMHRLEDLGNLLQAEGEMMANLDLAPHNRRSLQRRIAQTRRKYALRNLLHVKKERGLLVAMCGFATHPFEWYGVMEGVALDKVHALRARRRPQQQQRLEVQLLL
jgi:succinoglycan biosynthesis protein ExoU